MTKLTLVDFNNITILIGFILGGLIACIFNTIFIYYFLFYFSSVQMVMLPIIIFIICGLVGGLIGYNIKLKNTIKIKEEDRMMSKSTQVDFNNIIILIGFTVGSLIACILSIIYLDYFISISTLYFYYGRILCEITIIAFIICGLAGGLIGYNKT